jgi:curved DNA-binding protein CbpA
VIGSTRSAAGGDAGLVSVIPQDIPDFGSATLAPRQNPRFSPGAEFTTEDYFVWSRLDGHTSLRDVILMVGLGAERAIGILRKLRARGAVLLPGETPESVPMPAPAANDAPPASTAAVRRPRPSPAPPIAILDPPSQPVSLPMDLDTITVQEARALAEAVELQDGEKRRIIQMMRLVSGGDYFAMLGVPRGVAKRELRRAYHRVSMEFHPDRHYGHKLGSFAPWLHTIFERATHAFQVLSDDHRRAEYLAEIGEEPSEPSAQRPPDKSMQAAQRFERACAVEANGDRETAMRLFAAAVEDDPHPRYYRRAARCALALGKLSEAEEYAKNAARLRADDASYARTLADVYRAAHKLDEAEKILQEALSLPTISDLLARELEGDLKACARERLRRRRDD